MLAALAVLGIAAPGRAAGPCGDFLPPSDSATDSDVGSLFGQVRALVDERPAAVRECAEVAEVLLRVADRSEAMGAWRRAGEACDLLKAAGRLSGEGWLICAKPRLARGDLEGARGLLEAAVHEAGPDPASRLRMLRAGASLLEGRARPGMAADLLAEAVALAPADADMALRHLRDLLEAGREGEAVRAAEAAARRFGKDRETLRALVLLLARHGRAAPAAAAARALLRLPGLVLEDVDATVVAAAAAKDSGLARAAANALRDGATAGERPRAVREAVEALRRHGETAAAAEFLGESLRGAAADPADLRLLGALRAAIGDVAGAESAFEASLAASPEGTDGALAVAREWLRAREPARAVATLRRAVAASRAVPSEVWLALGRALHETGDQAGERAAYRDAAARAADPAATWMEVAEHLLGRGDARGADEAFREAVAAAAGTEGKARALAGRAEAMLAAGSARDAVERVLREALDTGTRDPAVLARVERVASRAGEDKTLRAAVMEAAVRREPDRADLWTRLALARLEAGRPAEAAKAWTEAVDRAPDRSAALADAVSRLVKAGAVDAGLTLAGRAENRAAVTPGLAQVVGSACLSLGDAPCAARYLRLFLAGPMALDHDYEATGRALAAVGLHDLALAALERAIRVAAPDRRWEVEVVAGRVLLLARRWDEADRRFEAALESSGQKRGVPLRIAREILALGRPARAAPWLARAAAEPDVPARLQSVPLLLETLARLGRDDEVSKVLAGLEGVAWRRAQPLQATALALAAGGRAADGAALVRTGIPTVREDERPALALLELALWLRAGRVDDALGLARASCAEPGEAGDASCGAAAARLEGRDRPDLALEILAQRAAAGLAGTALRTDLAVRLLRSGDRAGALEQARAVAAAAASAAKGAGALLAPLGEAFRGLGLAADWRGVVLSAVARAEGPGDPEVLLEEVRTLLALGEEGAAALATEAFLGARRGGEGPAWRAWMEAGARERADRWVEGAGAEALGAMDPADLQAIAEEWERAGRGEAALALLQRYREAGEGVVALEEAVGRILADLGRHEKAVEVLSSGPSGRLSDEARAALVSSLWRLGRRAQSLSAALSGLEGDARRRNRTAEHDDGTAPAAATLAFFLAEGAAGEALALLDRWLATPGPVPDPALNLARARLRLRVGGAGAREAARADLLAALGRLQGPSDDVTRLVRDEVRAGGGASLAQVLEGVRGVRAGEALVLAACLSGRRELLSGALERLSRDPLSSPAAILAAARGLLECGRFEEAAPLALRALEAWPLDRGVEAVLAVAVVAARQAGCNQNRAVEAELANRMGDPVAVQSSLAAARFEAGDDGGVVRARLEAARYVTLDPGAALAAVEASLRAGDEAARREAEAMALAATDDRPGTRMRLAELYQRTLRDDLAADVLSTDLPRFPGDVSLAGRVALFRLRAGDAPAAARAAQAYADRHGNPRAAAADIVSAAAREMDLDLAGRWAGGLAEQPRDNGVATALLEASRAFGRAGRRTEAESLARRAARAAPDPVRLRNRAAQAVLADPEVPGELVAWVGGGGPAEGPGTALPAERLAACGEAPDGAAARRCALNAATGAAGAAGLLTAADRALAAGRWESARALQQAADEALRGSAALRRAMAARILSYLGESSEAPIAARRLLGEPALSWIEADPVPRDGDGGALLGHLSEMARGLRAGVEAYEREIAVAPADGGLRNNLAYLLSLAGGDLERAQREARTAVLLSPRGAPYYLETEAWARFLRDGPAGALPLQERARRTWTLEQGGGVAEGLWHLGRMLEAAGRRGQAREAYRRASVLEPADWSGVRALRRWRELVPAAAGPR